MRQASRFISVVSSVVVVAGLAACAAPMSQPAQGSTYPAATYPASTYPAQNPQGNYIEYGRVSNVEVLRTQQPASTSGLGAVIGAVGGAVAGNAVEKNRNTQPVNESYRVSVQLDNGGTRAYDVPSYGELRIGDRVKIENNQLYRMR